MCAGVYLGTICDYIVRSLTLRSGTVYVGGIVICFSEWIIDGSCWNCYSVLWY